MIPAGGGIFEVRNGSEAFGVDEKNRTCSCRMWQLSGLPCTHAIAVIFRINKRVESYVPNCFRKQMFHDAYHQYLTPISGMSFWPNTSEMSKVLPPEKHKMPGRHRKKRIRASHEIKNPNKVPRTGIEMTCSNCFQKGHNKKGCKNETVVKPTKPPAKKGRPRKPTSSGLVDEDEPLVQPFRTTPDERPRSSEFDGGIDRPTVKTTNKTKKKQTKQLVKMEKRVVLVQQLWVVLVQLGKPLSGEEVEVEEEVEEE